MARSRSQMKDKGHVPCCSRAIIAREEIARDHVDLRSLVAGGDRVKPGSVAGGSRETTHVAKAAIQQVLHQLGPDETGRARDQDQVVVSDGEDATVCRCHAEPTNPTGEPLSERTD